MKVFQIACETTRGPLYVQRLSVSLHTVFARLDFLVTFSRATPVLQALEMRSRHPRPET